LSGNYVYEDRGFKDIICYSPSKNNIYPNVISYDYNDNFIIAIQTPNLEQYKFFIAEYLLDDTNTDINTSPNNQAKRDKFADSILKYDPYYLKIFSHDTNYWIISHKNKQLYGPFTKEEFLQKRKELKVPENLVLN
jgi:hypothetical protein